MPLLLLVRFLFLLFGFEPQVVRGHVAELLSAVFPEDVHKERIHIVRHEQHAVALFEHGLHLRQVLGVFGRIGDDEVYLILFFGHVLHVVRQPRHPARGGLEHQQVFERVFVCAVVVHDAVLQLQSEAAVELPVFLGFVLHHAFQLGPDLLGQVGTDRFEGAVVLQHLPGDVEREVRRIHDSAHEAQVVGEQVRALLHYQHSR